MTLLSICQEICNDAPVDTPDAFFGNNLDDTARLAVSSAQRAGLWIARRHNWLILTKEWTFSTVASQDSYSLPTDFSHLVNDTLWDRTNYEKIRGPLNAQEWQEYKSSVLSSTVTTWKKYRIRATDAVKKFFVEPTPAAVESLVFEYITTNWVKSTLGVEQTKWQADTDYAVIDEELIFLEARWRFLNRLGFAYAEEKAEARTEIDKAVARDGGSKILNLSSKKAYRLLSPNNVPDAGFGS